MSIPPFSHTFAHYPQVTSIQKCLPSPLSFQVVFTMLLGFLFFGAPLGLSGLISGLLVGAGVALYSRPVPVLVAEDELKVV